MSAADEARLLVEIVALQAEANRQKQEAADIQDRENAAIRQKMTALEREQSLLDEALRKRQEATNAIASATAKLEKYQEYLQMNTGLSDQEILSIQNKIKEQQKSLEKAKEILATSEEDVKKAKERVEQEKKLNEQRQKGKEILEATKSIVLTIYSRIKQELIEIDGLNAKLVANTGQLFRFTGGGSATAGVGIKQLTEAYSGLYTEMAEFSDLTPQLQSRLAFSSGALSRLGIGAELSGKNLNILNKGLGMSAQKADAMQKQLVKSAIGAGIVPKKMLEDFGSAMSRLGFYGEKGVSIFDKMEKQAKALGLSVSDLTEIFGENMDTFEGTNQIVGDLNSLFGQNIFYTEELLKASEDERVEIVKRKLGLMGITSETEKFNKKAIMQALHIKDVTKFNNFLSGSMSDVDAKTRQKAITDEKLNQIISRTVPLMERLSLMIQNLATVFQPVFDVVSRFIGWLAQQEKWLQMTIIGLWMFKGVIFSIIPVFTIMGNVIAGLATSLIQKFIPSVAAAGTTSALSAGEMLAFGFSTLMIGASIAIVVLSIGYLISKFETLNKIGSQAALNFLAIAAGIAAIMLAASNPIGIAGLMAILGLAAIAGLTAVGVSAFMGGDETAGTTAATPAAPKTDGKDQIENIAKYSAQTVQELIKIKGVLEKIATMNKEVNIQIDGEKVAKAIEPYLGGNRGVQ